MFKSTDLGVQKPSGPRISRAIEALPTLYVRNNNKIPVILQTYKSRTPKVDHLRWLDCPCYVPHAQQQKPTMKLQTTYLQHRFAPFSCAHFPKINPIVVCFRSMHRKFNLISVNLKNCDAVCLGFPRGSLLS